VLVEQRFLRKKYKDPITKDDFQPIYANQSMMPGGPSAPGGSQRPGQQGTTQTTQAPGGQVLQAGFNSTGATAAGGIIGVTSKSKEASIKILNGRQKYNEWAFVHVQTSQRPGGPGGPAPGFQGAPNQRPGPGQQGPQGQGQQNSPFGMNPGAFPQGSGGRGGMQGPPPSPFGQPTRPPFGAPGGTSPFGQPMNPSNPGQRPPGQRPPGQ
jgi:hypothetical protein